jgi:hypothetical protein
VDWRRVERLERKLAGWAQASDNAVAAYRMRRSLAASRCLNGMICFVTRCRVEDSARAVKIAAGCVARGMSRSRAARAWTGRARPGENGFNGEEAWDRRRARRWPWNRRRERNAFRKQLIAWSRPSGR